MPDPCLRERIAEKTASSPVPSARSTPYEGKKMQIRASKAKAVPRAVRTPPILRSRKLHAHELPKKMSSGFVNMLTAS